MAWRGCFQLPSETGNRSQRAQGSGEHCILGSPPRELGSDPSMLKKTEMWYYQKGWTDFGWGAQMAQNWLRTPKRGHVLGLRGSLYCLLEEKRCNRVSKTRSRGNGSQGDRETSGRKQTFVQPSMGENKAKANGHIILTNVSPAKVTYKLLCFLTN